MTEPYFAPDQLDETGCPAWINALGGMEYPPNHMVHVVRDLEPADALELLGVDLQAIRPCVLPPGTPATYAVDGTILVGHSDCGFEATDLEDDAPQEVRAAAGAAGTVDVEHDDGITMRMICALAGLPRTLAEFREIPLVITPFDSRPYLFRPSPKLDPSTFRSYPFR